MPFSSPPDTRLGSLEDGSQLPLATFVTLLTFGTFLAFAALITLLALAALITLSQTWLAPALAFALAFRIAFAIPCRGGDRFPNS